MTATSGLCIRADTPKPVSTNSQDSWSAGIARKILEVRFTPIPSRVAWGPPAHSDQLYLSHRTNACHLSSREREALALINHDDEVFRLGSQLHMTEPSLTTLSRKGKY